MVLFMSVLTDCQVSSIQVDQSLMILFTRVSLAGIEGLQATAHAPLTVFGDMVKFLISTDQYQTETQIQFVESHLILVVLASIQTIFTLLFIYRVLVYVHVATYIVQNSADLVIAAVIVLSGKDTVHEYVSLHQVFATYSVVLAGLF
jgi:hypothetical protein